MTFLYFDGIAAPVPRNVTLMASPCVDVTIEGMSFDAAGVSKDLMASARSLIFGLQSTRSLMTSSSAKAVVHSSALVCQNTISLRQKIVYIFFS